MGISVLSRTIDADNYTSQIAAPSTKWKSYVSQIRKTHLWAISKYDVMQFQNKCVKKQNE